MILTEMGEYVNPAFIESAWTEHDGYTGKYVICIRTRSDRTLRLYGQYEDEALAVAEIHSGIVERW
jgi:hypothetical protein